MATFGSTTVYGGLVWTIDKMRGSHFTCPEAGIADSISVYVYSYKPKATCLLYKHSDNSKVGETEEKTPSATRWQTWDFEVPKPTLENIEYWLIYATDEEGGMAYVGNSERGGYENITYPTFPDPCSLTLEDKIFAIYCTYTPAPTAVSHTFGDGLFTGTFVSLIRKTILEVVGLPKGGINL